MARQTTSPPLSFSAHNVFHSKAGLNQNNDLTICNSSWGRVYLSIGFGLEHLGHFTLRFPKLIAVIVLAFTALCLAQFPKVTVDGNILRVYKDSGEQYDNYMQLQQTFGTFENDAYVLARSPHLTEPAVLEKLRELAFDLELSSYAVGTLSPFSLRKPAPNNVTVPAVPENMQSREEVADALRTLRANDPVMRNLITEDLTGIVMIMFPDKELTKGRGESLMLEELRDLITYYDDGDITVELTGPPVWKTEMLDATISDQVMFSIAGFIIGAIMSLVCLRSIGGALLATLTPAISVIWVVGVVVMLFGSFTFLTNIVTTLVLVIAFAESMYFCFTWLRLWRDGMEPITAISETVKRITPAAALTTITTMVSFATLIATQGKGIQEFAISGMIAVGLTYVALVTFLPLALKIAVHIGFQPSKKMSIAVSAPIPLARYAVRRFAKAISILSIVAIIALLYPHFVMKPHFDFQDFLPNNSKAMATAEGIDDGVGGIAPIYVRVPLKDAVQNVTDSDFAAIEKVHAILESTIGAGKVISAASFSHYSNSGFSRDQIFNAVGPFLMHRFITVDNKEALITGFVPTVLRSEQLREIVQKTDAALASAGIADAQVAGFNVLTAFASTDIIGSLRTGLTAAILINIAVIGFAFRSWRVALLSVIPNFLPILGTELYLWTSGAGLQLTTVIALTIAFGIAVDDTIHFLATYMRSRQGGYDHEGAIDHSLETVGPALVATTLILCAGTFIVIFSALPQVALFGTLLVLTLTLALLGDLFILPALLMAGGRFFHSLGASK